MPGSARSAGSPPCLTVATGTDTLHPMQQEERSERSRRQILDTALDLFSHQGYRATSVREIADEAGVSTGNLYYHFPDKEAIFRSLLDEYWEAISSPTFPLNAVLASEEFPENLEDLGHAARESVIQYRQYVALIYVDVIEFDGSHIRKFYEEMADRFERFIDHYGRKKEIEQKLRPGLSAVSAVMVATRFFLNYFSVEVLFGVKNHFGKETDEVIAEIADMLRHGMLRNGSDAPAAPVAKPSVEVIGRK